MNRKPKQKNLTKFFNRFIAFTDVIEEKPKQSIIFKFLNDFFSRDIDLSFVPTKKLILIKAIYKNKRYPYILEFFLQDS